MTRAQDVADLMGQRIGRRGTFVMDNGKGVLCIRRNTSCQTAPVGIINDEHHDIRTVFVSKIVNFIHVAIAFIGEAKD